ncbi:MAG: tetratricopeptide repeat protein [Rickettsiales bacterium]|jgi:hypothetical protein|nr:tetratricopeptide repeat protein [Rickettsiales bacterium]
MANILRRNQKTKLAPAPVNNHSDDALYREISEEVHAEKVYNFVRKNMRAIIICAIALVMIVAGTQLYKHFAYRSAVSQAKMFEDALALQASGDAAGAEKMYQMAAEKVSNGMSDLALFESAMIDIQAGRGTEKLAQLATGGATRDFRDLARVRLATINGDKMSADEFAKFMRPAMTKKSPVYYTAMIMVAQKYIASDDTTAANKIIDEIISDKNTPENIRAIAQIIK